MASSDGSTNYSRQTGQVSFYGYMVNWTLSNLYNSRSLNPLPVSLNATFPVDVSSIDRFISNKPFTIITSRKELSCLYARRALCLILFLFLTPLNISSRIIAMMSGALWRCRWRWWRGCIRWCCCFIFLCLYIHAVAILHYDLVSSFTFFAVFSLSL